MRQALQSMWPSVKYGFMSQIITMVRNDHSVYCYAYLCIVHIFLRLLFLHRNCASCLYETGEVIMTDLFQVKIQSKKAQLIMNDWISVILLLTDLPSLVTTDVVNIQSYLIILMLCMQVDQHSLCWVYLLRISSLLRGALPIRVIILFCFCLPGCQVPFGLILNITFASVVNHVVRPAVHILPRQMQS